MWGLEFRCLVAQSGGVLKVKPLLEPSVEALGFWGMPAQVLVFCFGYMDRLRLEVEGHQDGSYSAAVWTN